MDKEVYELCKQVYEATKWVDEDWKQPYMYIIEGETEIKYSPSWFSHLSFSVKNPIKFEKVPLYTSDYLLEKLPKKLRIMEVTYWLTLSPMDKNDWGVSYEHDDTLTYSDTFHFANTPLKALLKLCLALKDAGEL